MAYNVVPLNRLVEQFEKLPGIGKKTAQRLAFYVLSLPEDSAKRFAKAILDAQDKIKKCQICLNFTDGDTCSVCTAENRDKNTICVVESPRDVLVFERVGDYHGQYHVLHGLISPMDGIGPDQIYLKELLQRVADNEITEVIMATNPTVEGEATAMYIAKLLKPFEIKVTRLAYGLPVGGSLEYADEITLNKALEGRSEII